MTIIHEFIHTSIIYFKLYEQGIYQKPLSITDSTDASE